MADADMAVGVHHLLAREDAIGDNEVLEEAIEAAHARARSCNIDEASLPHRVGTNKSSTGTGAGFG